jgi:hypothetical protein
MVQTVNKFKGSHIKIQSLLGFSLNKKKSYLSTFSRTFIYIKTQYKTNSTLFCPVTIEYVTKNNIFGLKMMMKSGLEKIILKFLHAQAIFYSINLPHRKDEF